MHFRVQVSVLTSGTIFAALRLDSKYVDVASSIVRAAGGRLILAALDCLDAYASFVPSFVQWFNECAKNEFEVFNWLNERDHFGIVVKQGLASTMNPRSNFIISKGLSPLGGPRGGR